MRRFISFIALLSSIIASDVPVHAQTNLPYEYDANGSLIRGDGKYYEYNDANKLVRIRHGDASGGIIAEYFYDYNGQRIKKVENGVTTYYVGKHYVTEVNDTNTENTKYYFANKERVAKKDVSSGILTFLHSDHLGGTNAITDSIGNLIERTNYYPFGEVKEGGQERFIFTGKEKDSLTDFYYFEARYYKPEFKHFTQADALSPNLYDPQELNKYAYVENNPLKYIDPNGASALLITWKVIDIVTDGHYEMLVPRHGNWGGPSWSGGGWDFRSDIPLNDPIWRKPYIDQQDYYYKQHDIGYRTGNQWGADINLVDNLKKLDKSSMKSTDKAYAKSAENIFTVKKGARLVYETARPSSLAEASETVGNYIGTTVKEIYQSTKDYAIEKYNRGKEFVNRASSKIKNLFSD